MHPLRPLLEAAARGALPPSDGGLDLWPAAGALSAVCAFSGHFVVAADVPPGWVRARLPPGDFIAPHSPAFLDALGQRLGLSPGTLDVVLAALPDTSVGDGLELVPFEEAEAPGRLVRARSFRDEVRAWSTRPRGGLVILGRGLAGRWELSIETDSRSRGQGLGRRLAMASRRLVPPGEAIFAQTSPGNAASLRALLAAGFVPLGSEVIFAAAPDV